MTYTQLALLAVVVTIVVDLGVLRTQLLTKRAFWAAYAIIVFFQLLSNGILTGFRIVRYDGDAIMGSTTPQVQAPAFLGDGRVVFAPVEDLMFGFALVVMTMALWVWWGRRGLQRMPYSGPPVGWFPGVNLINSAEPSGNSSRTEATPGDSGLSPRG